MKSHALAVRLFLISVPIQLYQALGQNMLFYADEVPEKQRIKSTKLLMTIGKLEVTIKINEVPTDLQTNKDNWKIFQLDCNGRVGEVTAKAKNIISLKQT